MPQVQLEVIDIWHFGLSALFGADKSIESLADEIYDQLENHEPTGLGVREATEALALYTLETKGFSATKFWDLMLASGLNFDSLYTAYVGKNVLNFFRQDNGYKDGSYIKNWAGREDNEFLVDIMAEADHSAEDFAEKVYKALQELYREFALKR